MGGTTSKRGSAATAVAVVLCALGLLLSSFGSGAVWAATPARGSVGGGTTTTTGPTGTQSGPATSPTSDGSVPSFGPPTTFAADQQWMVTAIDDRLRQLSSLTDKVAAAQTLQSGDRTSLDGSITADETALTTLSSAVGAASTSLQLHTAAEQMVALHVYLVLTPQVDLTIRADADVAAASSLLSLEADLNTAIAAAHAPRPKLAALRRMVKHFDAEANGTADLAGPVPADVLALEAGSLSVDQPVLGAAGRTLKSAQTALTTARTVLRDILSTLADPHLNANTKRVLRRR